MHHDDVWGPHPASLVAAPRPGFPTTIFLRGEVDFTDARRLATLLGVALDAHPKVTVDLVDATFIDACIVGVLAQANARNGGSLRVRGATGIVTRVFQITGLDHLLDR